MRKYDDNANVNTILTVEIPIQKKAQKGRNRRRVRCKVLGWAGPAMGNASRISNTSKTCYLLVTRHMEDVAATSFK